MESLKVRISRASTSEQAKKYRQKGHDDALRFALAIGLDSDYQNDIKAKKDVIDPSGDAHSVKSGEKKWQIFLYAKSRFEQDSSFQVMNGIGQILVKCIDSFPKNIYSYEKNKGRSKEKLRKHMRNLAEKLKEERRLKAFIEKSMFNGGEVNYLTVLDNKLFHVFWGKEVAKVMLKNLVVDNSKARRKGEYPEQKVIFKYEGVNLAELEMRNDSETHYREIRFNMIKRKAMKLLYSKIINKKNFSHEVILYGEATKHFGRWKK